MALETDPCMKKGCDDQVWINEALQNKSMHWNTPDQDGKLEYADSHVVDTGQAVFGGQWLTP